MQFVGWGVVKRRRQYYAGVVHWMATRCLRVHHTKEDHAMAMPPINHSDINERFDRMGANWMLYMHTMQDGLLAQMRVDKSDLQKEIATVRGEVATVREEVAALGEEVATLSENVTALGAKVTALEAKVTALEAKVGEEVASLRAELKQDIANLRNEMLARQAALQKRQEATDAALTEVKQLLLEILTNQRELRAYVDARARDTDAIVANAVAQLSEQINDVRRRLPPEAPQA